ncbi:glycosyltransferase family 2 protein [Acidocella sp.]|uniref:glycosyltransferase family 2 protein n=1 Tax=Acidocella sp. TaxID=50710 RepID=UPI00262CFA84|nr:glycosyltransferase family 2 protein [Acidocella sp.]
MQQSLKAPLGWLYTTQPLPDAGKSAEAVSIIMRTKDRALLLPRAVQSVLAQSLADWKLYLVNDGGDVAMLEAVLAPYRDAFAQRLLVTNHAVSKGMEAASNVGLMQATGRYFVIHDDDDRWAPDFLKRTVEFLEAPENATYIGVATGCDVVQERIEGDQIVTVAQFPWRYFQPPVTYAAMLARNQMPPITLLLRRSLLQLIGGFNEALPVLGDWEFILRALAVGDVGALEESLAFYHHRLAVDQPVYANSVTGGVNIHAEMRTRMGNHIVRTALCQEPALLGVLWPVLQALDAQDVRQKADDAVLQRLEQRLGVMEAELRAVREAVEPQRRVVAWLRRWRRKAPSAP